jgi:peptidoglycan hydrolase-like protein with peptidoglycan-binding domain
MSRPLVILALVLAGMLGLAAVGAGIDAPGDRGASVLPVSGLPASGLPAVGASSDAPDASNGEVASASTVPADIPDTVNKATELSTEQLIGPGCTVAAMLREGHTGAEIACLHAALVDEGALALEALDAAVAGTRFDVVTRAAVRAFQQANGLVVDGIVGPQTAKVLGIWSGPDVLPPDPSTCAASGRSVVVDRFNQRAWFCSDGSIERQFPVTTARSQPDPGDYQVYAKDLNASSVLTGEYSTMTHFVAFTYGKYQGARIAFHSVPKYRNGAWVQPLDTVGDPDRYGDSSGCIRVLPDDAVAIWDWLDMGGTVRVLT